MRIGLTFDLRSHYLALGYSEEQTAEFDREETVSALEEALQQLGHQTARIGHAQQLVERLAGGERWDLVFNICEGLFGIAREAQVPAILDLYRIPYTFSDPLVMALTLHKEHTKTVVAAAGVATPRGRVVRREADLAALDLRLPLFVKPLAEGTGKGVDPSSVIRQEAAIWRECALRIERFGQPVLLEEYLPGRELTVGILGTGRAAEVLGTIEVRLRAAAEAEVYSYKNKELSEELVDCDPVSAASDPVVAQAEAVALAAWRALDCRDAGRVDLRCDDAGRPRFIEVNPLAGLHPTHSDLPLIATGVGLSYVDLIGRIVQHASSRLLPGGASGQAGAPFPGMGGG